MIESFIHSDYQIPEITRKLTLEARKSGKALPQLGALAAERRELREARKKHRALAVVPEEARANKYIAQAESMAAQITNDDSSATMRGFAVSSDFLTWCADGLPR